MNSVRRPNGSRFTDSSNILLLFVGPVFRHTSCKGSLIMTRKDYVLLAQALLSQKPIIQDKDNNFVFIPDEGQVAQWTRDVQAIASALAADNPRFDRDRFLNACGLEN